MHIHNANLNAASQLAQPSQSVLASRRASETRKKLFASAAELEAASSIPDPWAVSVVGSFAGSQQGSGAFPEHSASVHNMEEEVPKASASGPVSYWA